MGGGRWGTGVVGHSGTGLDYAILVNNKPTLWIRGDLSTGS